MSNVRQCLFGLFVVAAAVAFPVRAQDSSAAEMRALSAKVADDQKQFVKDDDGNLVEKRVEEPAPAAFAPKVMGSYAFTTTTTASLADMSTGTTQLLAPNLDDTPSPVTLLGFDFLFNGARQDRFSINDNGVVRFGATAQTATPYKPLAQAGLPIVTAYGADQRTHTTGRVHFRTTGTAPTRVATIEWLNNQANFNAGGTADLTYQVRLFETTGCIEFIYGSMTMSAAGAASTDSRDPHIGFSTSNVANSVGSVAAPQSGTPAPTFNGASATPTTNLYTAGSIAALSSAAQGARRNFLFCAPAPAPAGGPLTFTGVTATSMTLNWTDAPDELGYLVYNSTDGINFTLLGQVAQNATSFVASGLQHTTSYTWQVVSFSEGALASALTDVQGTNPPGSVSSTAAGGPWSSPATWAGGAIPTAGDIATIVSGALVTIDISNAVALDVIVESGATLEYQTTPAAALAAGGNVLVQAGGTFRTSATGATTGHTLTVGGNLTNDGTLDFSTNGATAGAGIAFTSAANATFGGSGPTTDIRTITVNKGTSSTSVLQLNPASFTVQDVATDVAGWLVQTNGTLRLSGTFTGTNRVFGVAAYTIPATAGFWLDNPNYVVAAQAGNAVNNGLFRVSQGTFNQGTLISHSFRGGTGAVFTIEGGTLNFSAQFSPQNAVTYNQSGGTMNVGLVGNNQSAFGTFELFSTASTFNMTGGSIVVHQASTGATPIDFQNRSTANPGVTGTLVLGSPATATNFLFRLRGNTPNLTTDNTTNNKNFSATAQVNLRGTTTINAGSTFTINGFTCLVIGPSFINNGTLVGTAASTRFYFLGGSGPTTYSGTGTVTAPLTAFEVDNVAGVTIDPATTNQIVATRFNNFSGGLTGSGKLTLGNGGATTAIAQLGVTGVVNPVLGFDVPPVFNPGTGGVNLIYAPELTGRTTGNEMPASRTLNLLFDSNPNPLTIAGGDVTVTGTTATTLQLVAGRILTGSNTLHLTNGVGTVTRTAGHVDGNLRKTFAAATPAAVPFEVGSANGFSPVSFNVTAGTFPAVITARAAQGTAPGISPVDQAISRYWDLTASDVTADLVFNYLDPPDVPGTVTEATLLLYRFDGGTLTNVNGTINAGANTASVTGISQFSRWTLAAPGVTVIGVLAISPTAINFGDQAVATTSAPSSVTLSNTGGATLNVTTLTDATTPFERSGGTCSPVLPITIAAGASCTLDYRFTPTVAGAAGQTLTVDAGTAGSGTIGLSGNGVQGNLTITPGSVPFGDVLVGATTAESTVTLANTGTASLDVTALTAAAAPFARTATGTCSATLPITIAAGTNCTLTYTFSPTVTGAANQTLTVTANAPGSGTITLTGNGVQGMLAITPTTVPFGNVTVGSTSNESTVTLANVGTAPLNVSALTAATAPFARTATGTCSATLPITIAAGTSCTLTYTFTPTVTGAANQTLTVTANAPGDTSFSLSGNGVQGNLTIAPTTVPFGDVLVGSTSPESTVTLANNGTATLDVTALTAAAAPFARTATGTCSATLPITIGIGGSCTLTFTYAPTIAGPANQTLTVTANAPGSGTIDLTGNGIQGNVLITPAAVSFGTYVIGFTSSEQFVTIANAGTASLSVTAITAAAAPFAQTATGTCAAMLPFMLAPGANCTLGYTFAPTAEGAAMQSITVTADAPGDTGFSLNGNGTASEVIFSGGFEDP